MESNTYIAPAEERLAYYSAFQQKIYNSNIGRIEKAKRDGNPLPTINGFLTKALRILTTYVEIDFKYIDARQYLFDRDFEEVYKPIFLSAGLVSKNIEPKKWFTTKYSEYNIISVMHILQNMDIKIFGETLLIEGENGYVTANADTLPTFLKTNYSLTPDASIYLASQLLSYLYDTITERMEYEINVPRTFSCYTYSTDKGVIDLKARKFIPEAKSSDAYHFVRGKFENDPVKQELINEFFTVISTDTNGYCNPELRKQMIANFMYGVFNNQSNRYIIAQLGCGGNGKSIFNKLEERAFGLSNHIESLIKMYDQAEHNHNYSDMFIASSTRNLNLDDEKDEYITRKGIMTDYFKLIDSTLVAFTPRKMGGNAETVYFRGVARTNMNKTKWDFLQEGDISITRRFRTITFPNIISKSPYATKVISRIMNPLDSDYVYLSQADLLYFVFTESQKYTEEELQTPCYPFEHGITITADINSEDIIKNYIRKNKTPLLEFMSEHTNIKISQQLDYQYGFAYSEQVGRDLSKLTNQKINKMSFYDTACNIPNYRCMKPQNVVCVFFNDDDFKPEPEKESLPVEVTEDVSEMSFGELFPELNAQFVIEDMQAKKEIKEEVKPVAFKPMMSAICYNNGYISNDTTTDTILTDFSQLKFLKREDKATMPKVFPDTRSTRGDYSKTSNIMVLDIDHIFALDIEEVIENLKKVGVEMHVQESFNSKELDRGVHVFIPMNKSLDADEWNTYRMIIGSEVFNKTGYQYDKQHAGFRGVINGSFHDVINLEGKLAEVPELSFYLPNKSATEFDEWNGDYLVEETYLSMDSIPSQKFQELLDTQDLNEFEGERNSTVFMIAKDLVGLENRGAFQNGVFDTLWSNLEDIITTSCTGKDCAEFMAILNRAYGELEGVTTV